MSEPLPQTAEVVVIGGGIIGVSALYHLAKRGVLSPADLEAMNPNLVHGDIYAGSCALDQNLLWRPFAVSPGHRTTVDGLWHVGASTHPGPGLGAGSGYLVAKELTKPPLARRLVAKFPGRS